jgi:hypothetical protein
VVSIVPYITQNARASITSGTPPATAGELTYVLTVMVHTFIAARGEPTFQSYALALGALEATKLELYRRHVASYEQIKMEQNGDI